MARSTTIGERPAVPAPAPAPAGPGRATAASRLRSVAMGTGCSFTPVRVRRVQAALKRALDVVGASLLIAVLGPVFLVVAVLVSLESAGPVFFGQDRVGRDLRPFRIWKFRTMHDGADLERPAVDPSSQEYPLLKLPDDPRATRTGRALRRWSLDELPQLWNVLRGDMSLVGPRPRLPEEVLVDGLRQSLRLGVRPGATGPWQVSGRSTLAYADGVALELGYVRNWSLLADLKILARTPWAILNGKGAH